MPQTGGRHFKQHTSQAGLSEYCHRNKVEKKTKNQNKFQEMSRLKWHLCQAGFLEMNKKSGSSCEYNLTPSREQIYKCFTSRCRGRLLAVVLAWVQTLHFSEAVNAKMAEQQNERGGQTRTAVRGVSAALKKHACLYPPPVARRTANGGNIAKLELCQGMQFFGGGMSGIWASDALMYLTNITNTKGANCLL